MPTALAEPLARAFFASRSGVCVYVTVRGRAYRVQFAAPDAMGVVAGELAHDTDEALRLARSALQRHHATLATLFQKVAQKQT
jgi:hypothetical protein